jgi:hypothetical protein
VRMPVRMAAKVRRIALGRFERTFNVYARTDAGESPFSDDSRTIVATQEIWQIAIDTLAGRHVPIADAPSILEAAYRLRELLVDVPNNLSRIQKKKAIEAVTLLIAMSKAAGNSSTPACGRYLHSRQRRTLLARPTFSTPAHSEPAESAGHMARNG